MVISKSVILSCALIVVLVSAAHAKAEKIVGVVTATDGDSLQIRTKSGTTESVRLERKTSYMKWITHRPWGQDTRADRTFLQSGRCVTIEVRAEDRDLAAPRPSEALFDLTGLDNGLWPTRPRSNSLGGFFCGKFADEFLPGPLGQFLEKIVTLDRIHPLENRDPLLPR